MGVWRERWTGWQSPHVTAEPAPTWVRVVAGFFLVVLLVGLAAIGYVHYVVSDYYADRYFPGVRIEGYDVGGMTRPEVRETLSRELSRRRSLAVEMIASDPTHGPVVLRKTQQELGIDWNLDVALAGAFLPGHTGDFLTDAGDLLFARTVGIETEMPMRRDESAVRRLIESFALTYVVAPQDGTVKLVGAQVVTTPSVPGRRLDVDASVAAIEQHLPLTAARSVELVSLPLAPHITDQDVRAAALAASSYLAGPLIVKGEEVEERLSVDEIARALKIVRVDGFDPTLRVEFDNTPVNKLAASLPAKLDQKARSTDFKLEGGKFVILRPSVLGRRVDVPTTAARMVETVRSQQQERVVPIAIEYTQPRIADEHVKSWVKLANSRTYYESAADRMYNIELAAERLNHVAIDPGAKFSLNGALGAQDSSNGYRSAFVIVNERTQPGPGGGLCQVATTLFQAAFWGGYKIHDRTEHSYWIKRYASVSPKGNSYVGLDAAIDTGEPDLVFENNTSGHLYVHMRTDGARLYVDLYGPPPGWTVDIADYWVGNYKASDGKVVHHNEPSLPAGQVVLVEDARQGFDTSLTRVVSKDGKVVDKQTFTSHYVPTNTVFLHGTGGR